MPPPSSPARLARDPLAPIAALLGAAGSAAGLTALAARLGFPAEPYALDPDVRAAMGLADAPVIDARVASGPGTLRALLVECDGNRPIRHTVELIARRLAARVPHLAWLLIAARPADRTLAIATWRIDGPRPRIAALVVDRDRVVPSDAETVAAIASVPPHSDLLAHSAWMEILGREALGRRFYRELERTVADLARCAGGRATPEERSQLALLYTSRLLFLGFLEARGWLDGDHRFLATTFARCMERGGRFHQRVLLPLFFGTLNTPPRARAAAARAFGLVPFLNGGLFARTPVERRRRELRFPDDGLGTLIGDLLGRYRFTPREESAQWSESAIDPEILGRSFECLMEARARRASGAFYTPHQLVARVTTDALGEALAGGIVSSDDARAALGGERVDPPVASALDERASRIAVLDPACGSGAFLVHALEELAALRSRLGDPRPIAELRREVLTRSLFGVDANPTAVWLCELRLWLSTVIECDASHPLDVPPLPNLDRHIRVGDSLDGEAFAGIIPPGGGARLAQLRERYARATGRRKHTLQRALDRGERARVIAHLESELALCAARRRDLIAALRGRDLFGERARAAPSYRARLGAERRRSRELAATLRRVREGGSLPFAWVTHYPDVARRGGFDVVLGNPPWVRVHRIPLERRQHFRERFAVCRVAPWARDASGGRHAGFASQIDLAALFGERSLALLREGGVLALLLPTKLWRSLAGSALRRHLQQAATLLALEDWSDSPPAFDAAVYPSLLVARRAATAASPASDRPERDVRVSIHRPGGSITWNVAASALAFDEAPGSPWLIAPPAVRHAFHQMSAAGVPLARSPLGAPQLGVKCGCNDAFIVRWQGGDTSLAIVRSNDCEGRVERAILRPALRGEHVAAWQTTGDHEWIIWTHDDAGPPLAALPPHTLRWLSRWRPRLTRRTDLRDSQRWWTLFRTTAVRTDRSRVVWADVGRHPRALVLPADDCTVPINSCYVLPCADSTDADGFAALLNSPLVAAWLNVLAEPARGGYRRYLAWTVALLPIPHRWNQVRGRLATISARAVAGDEPDRDALLRTVLHAYDLRHETVAPLLAWLAP